MSVVVTGATGFIGRALIQALAQGGEDVISASRTPPKDAKGRWIAFDAAAPSAELYDELERASFVYHLAWSTVPSSAERDPGEDLRTNVGGALKLMDVLSGASRARLIFASSGGTVYGDAGAGAIPETTPMKPCSAYGAGKATVEQYLAVFGRLHNLDHTVVRLANPFGPGQSGTRAFGAVATFTHRMMAGQPLTLFGNGSVVRDYVYIDDVVSALLACRQPEAAGQTFNIGSGEGRSLLEVIDAAAAATGVNPIVEHLPGRAFDVPSNVLDVRYARERLDWSPSISFEEGVSRYVKSLRGQP